MAAWRAWVFFPPTAHNFSLVTGLCGLLALVLVLGSRRTVRIWPLWQLLFRFRNPFPRLAPRSRRKRTRPTTPPAWLSPAEEGPLLPKATSPGRTTGFEPRQLERIELKPQPLMAGRPGSGLSASGFSEENIKAGQKGELNFAKALQKAGLLGNFQTYWSVSLPDRANFLPSREYETDVDCIIVTGQRLYLVDLKNYKGGGLTYESERGKLQARDDATGALVRVSGKMSRNMELAQELFRSHLGPRGYTVVSRVVFMPQNSGEPKMKNVYWPGAIHAMVLTEFLEELSRETPFKPGGHDFLSQRMHLLLR